MTHQVFFLLVLIDQNKLKVFSIEYEINSSVNRFFIFKSIVLRKEFDIDYGLQAKGIYAYADLFVLNNSSFSCWIAGTNGLLRKISITYSKSNISLVEKSMDIDASETISCVNGVYAATMKGSLYSRKNGASDNAFTMVGKLSSTTIRYVTDSFAVADSSKFIIKNSANFWDTYVFGTQRYNYCYIDDNHDGHTVSLIDTLWRENYFVYKDTPTKISDIFPEKLINYINKSCYVWNTNNLFDMIIQTFDPDSNNSCGKFFIHTRKSIKQIPFIIKPKKFPSLYDSVRIKDNPIGIGLSSSLMTYSNNAEYMWHDPVSMVMSPRWKDTEYVESYPIVNGDTIVSIFGSDTLKILVDVAVAAASGNALTQGQSKLPIIHLKNKAFMISNIQNSYERLMIININGKIVFQTNLTKSSTFSINKNSMSCQPLLFYFIGANTRANTLVKVLSVDY